MHPVLIDFGRWRLPLLGEVHPTLATYGVVFAVVTLVAWILFVQLAGRRGIPRPDAEALALTAIVAGIIGSKATLVLLDLSWFLEDPSRLLWTVRSAGVLLGGVAFGLVAFVVVIRRRGLPALTVLDCAAVPLVLAQAAGRFGCFLAGCCYGRSAEGLAWAVVFTDPMAAVQSGTPLGVPLHPVQLYQLGADLLVFLALLWLWKRNRFAGQVFVAYLIVYSIDRAILEHWRGDAARGMWLSGRVSTSQAIALLALAAGIAMWPVLSRRRRPI